MPTSNYVGTLKINELTTAQYNAAVQSDIISDDDLSFLTDALDEQQTIMPTAEAKYEGQIVQFVGTTDASYTNGYFYKCTETLSFVGPVPDATGEPGESMVFALDSDAFAAYLQTKSIALAGQTTFYLEEESDVETGDSVYVLQDADYVTIEAFSSLVDMESTTGITWGGQEDFTGDFPYLAENATGFVVGPTYVWNQTDVQPSPVIPDPLPDQTGQSGKFLTTDGTDASWSDKPLVNNATALNTIGIGSGTVNTNGVSVGYNTYCFNGGVAIGYSARITGTGNTESVAIGKSSQVQAKKAIQIGGGTNTDANTFKVANENGNYEIMSANGTIPTARFTADPVSDGAYIPTVTLNSGVATRSWETPTTVTFRTWGVNE